MEKTITIAISGPESSGKTILCEALAKHYNAPYLPEYARSYLKDIGSNYSFKDVEQIAKKQIELEDLALMQNPALLFCDTDMINFKIWFEFYGHTTPHFIEERIINKPYNLTLLLYPNTLWVDDGLRKNKNDRMELYSLFEKYLVDYSYKFKKINKLEEERLLQGIQIIDNFLK